MSSRPFLILSALVALLLVPVVARADGAVPAPLEGIGIDDRTGASVPLDVAFRDQNGKTVTLGDYTKDGKPIVLTLAYYQCPMLCSIVLNGLQQGLSTLAWTAGKDFHVVTISIDPRDTVETAAKKRSNYLAAYGRDVGDRGWDFLVGDEAASRKIADAVGFHYRWDDTQKQYAHGAGAFVLTADGRISRTLYGIAFPEQKLRLAILEGSEGKLGSAWDKAVLLCFHYDPNTGSYVVAVKRLVKLFGLLTMIVLGTFLIRLWRRERRPPTPTASKLTASVAAPSETT